MSIIFLPVAIKIGLTNMCCVISYVNTFYVFKGLLAFILVRPIAVFTEVFEILSIIVEIEITVKLNLSVY
tara:strand:+ start:716 stop:925 length:210 start_codon:yes stop_codon:yes gene_type:complete